MGVPRRPDINLVLPTADAAERGGLEAFVARARDELSRTLGVDAPPRLNATFHATAAEDEKASSHPWFTSGALVDGSLHFLPAGRCAIAACSSGLSGGVSSH